MGRHFLALLMLGPAIIGTGGAHAEDKGRDREQTCALPLIVRAGLRDIRENLLNGPEGYAFFTEAGAPKIGDLPHWVGDHPERIDIDTDVYASNFQGPILVRHEGLRPQWEWTADGEVQISERRYPVPIAKRCAASAAELPEVTLHVEEHDEPPWANDPIGAFTFELHRCPRKKGAVDATGVWTSIIRAKGMPYDRDGGPSEIAFVEYKLWCSRR